MTARLLGTRQLLPSKAPLTMHNLLVLVVRCLLVGMIAETYVYDPICTYIDAVPPLRDSLRCSQRSPPDGYPR